MKYRKIMTLILLGFLLGIQDGYIALWKDGRAEPVEVFPFRAEMLPSDDQKTLEKGIRIRNADHLAQLMEDYLS